MKHKLRKSIAYAFPTSSFADSLGVSDTGGYYVQQYRRLEDGSWSTPFIAQGHDVFQDPKDEDLLALFAESDGEICPHFLRLGD